MNDDDDGDYDDGIVQTVNGLALALNGLVLTAFFYYYNNSN